MLQETLASSPQEFQFMKQKAAGCRPHVARNAPKRSITTSLYSGPKNQENTSEYPHLLTVTNELRPASERRTN